VVGAAGYAALRQRGRGEAAVPSLASPLGDASDDLIFEEADELFRVHVWRSRSRAWLFAASRSFTSSEVRYVPATDPAGAWRTVLEREKDHEYDVDHGVGPGDGVFYIRTNGQGRRNFRLVRTPVADPRPEHWTELIAHREDVMIEDVDVFAATTSPRSVTTGSLACA